MRRLLLAAPLLLALAAPAAGAQRQIDDVAFVPKVGKPAFTRRHPVVAIDEAHRNQFTARGGYRAFASLMLQDGLRVVAGTSPFSAASLDSLDVLVVADALGPGDPRGAPARQSAFTPAECDAVRDWVRAGGALLLVADHAPYASAMDSLATRFGVDFGKGQTLDTRYVDAETANPGCIVFRRDLGQLGDHPILRGRDRPERVDRVVTFTGQSLLGPRGSAGLLILSPTSLDLPSSPDARRRATPEALRKADTSAVAKGATAVTAVDRFQGVAFAFGKGRVVVLGEASMLGAQLLLTGSREPGKDRLRIGMNRPDFDDNGKLALNVARWLARGLD